MVPRDLKPNICISDFHFVNVGVPFDSSESAFKFLLRDDYVEGRKIKGLYACDNFEIENLRCSANYFEFLRIHIRLIPLFLSTSEDLA